MITKQLSTLLYTALFFVTLSSCGKKNKSEPIKQNSALSSIDYAKGFTVQKNKDFTVLEVLSAWPGADVSFKYALVPKEKLASISLPNNMYDAIVAIPVERLVVTSTTHIPSLEALGELESIVGFPGTDYISSPKARAFVEKDSIVELGSNENINTEIILELKPEMVMGFGINDTNKAYKTVEQSGTPVVYNGDWVEQTPLGKAEWIKFFAPFFQKEVQADSIFAQIEKSYNEAKSLAKKAKEKPTVLTGGLYKDVWYIAGGESWMAQFLKDANADYIWSDTNENGSIGMSLEAVLEKAQNADFWLNPSMHSSYEELKSANAHHQQFKAFKKKKVYSNAMKKGATGGLVFYELAPQRPDLVLKDIISILHPSLIPDYEPHFFMPLQ